MNGLIITPAPSETLSQFTDDFFHKFRDFNDMNIIVLCCPTIGKRAEELTGWQLTKGSVEDLVGLKESRSRQEFWIENDLLVKIKK